MDETAFLLKDALELFTDIVDSRRPDVDRMADSRRPDVDRMADSRRPDVDRMADSRRPGVPERPSSSIRSFLRGGGLVMVI